MDRRWGNNATKGNGWVVRAAFGVTRVTPVTQSETNLSC
jgi:hypothetical protein